MTRDEALAYLDAHIGWGMEPGLERMQAFVDLMGNPEGTYSIIHVAGTNGKTSVARMATLLCVAHGLTIGTYTSPHLERFEERISINGKRLTESQLVQAVTDVKAFADLFEQESHLTYFELVTALALAWFANEAVNAAVVEVGLGGRLDATNVVAAEVAVLASVGMDHMEQLGNTLEEIAAEKLAILEPEATLVVGPLPDDLKKLARRAAAEKGATIHEYGKDFSVVGSATAVGGWQLDVQGVFGLYEDIYLPVHGRHQAANLAVSVAAVEGLLQRPLDPGSVSEGISVMAAPGRMEIIATGPIVMLDGAHNADGMRALAAALREEYPSTGWTLVVGAMADKQIDEMLQALEDRVTSVVCTAISNERALAPDVLARRCREILGVEAETAPDVGSALERARQLAGPAGSVLVAGSLYLVGAARSHLSDDGPTDRNER